MGTEEVDAVATVAAAEAEAGFLPRFLGAVCGWGGSSCSDFLFLPGRDLGTIAGDTTWRGITTSTSSISLNIVTALYKTSTILLHCKLNCSDDMTFVIRSLSVVVIS